MNKICRNCNEVNSESSKYCSKCSAELPGTSSNVLAPKKIKLKQVNVDSKVQPSQNVENKYSSFKFANSPSETSKEEVTKEVKPTEPEQEQKIISSSSISEKETVEVPIYSDEPAVPIISNCDEDDDDDTGYDNEVVTPIDVLPCIENDEFGELVNEGLLNNSPDDYIDDDEIIDVVNESIPNISQVKALEDAVIEDDDDASIEDDDDNEYEEAAPLKNISQEKNNGFEKTPNSNRKNSEPEATNSQSRLDEITNDPYYNDILPEINNEIAVIPKDIIGKVILSFGVVVIMAVFLISRR